MTRKSAVRRSGGIEAFVAALEGSDHIRVAVNNAANAVRNVTRRLLNEGGKGGEFYYQKGGGRQYVASAPGEAPARYTGHLASHVSVRRAKKSKSMRATAWVGSTSPHAHLLEFGTVAMKARPHMGPASRQAKQQNCQNIKRAAKVSVREAARAALAKLKDRPF